MKKRKRSIILLCALLIIALILPCSGSEAASKLTKKQKATYKKCLDKYFYKTNWPSWWTSYVNDTKEHTEIAFADINNDGKKNFWFTVQQELPGSGGQHIRQMGNL